jgi:hypothetical protein
MVRVLGEFAGALVGNLTLDYSCNSFLGVDSGPCCHSICEFLRLSVLFYVHDIHLHDKKYMDLLPKLATLHKAKSIVSKLWKVTQPFIGTAPMYTSGAMDLWCDDTAYRAGVAHDEISAPGWTVT